MHRMFLVLIALGLPALADARSEFMDATQKLEEAYFDELKPSDRDLLFRRLGGYDDKDVIEPIAEIASRFGTYIAGVQAQLAAQQAKLEPLLQATAMTDIQIGRRNSYIRKIEAFEKQLRRDTVSERILVEVLGSLKESKTIEAALKEMGKHPTWRVRQLLARACALWHGSITDTRTSRRLFATLKTMMHDKESPVRVSVVRSLGKFHVPEALDLMALALKDGDWQVRAAAVEVLAEARTNEAVDLLIKQLAKEDGRLKDDIIKCLKEITGQKHNYVEAWAGWWQSVGKQVPPKKPSGEDAAGVEARAKDAAAFYGIPTRSDRICFIIDISGSMNHEVPEIKYKGPITGTGKKDVRPVGGKTRIEVAKNELKRAISNLNPKKEFSIIFFNHAVKVWRPQMEKATPTIKQAVRKDIDAVVASGATYTLGALRQAFVMAGVVKTKRAMTGKGGLYLDTIFLLSDGGPTDNKIEEVKPMDPDLILEQVKEWNKDAGVVIHCIAVDCGEQGTYFLKNLAAQNGGVFVERKQ